MASFSLSKMQEKIMNDLLVSEPKAIAANLHMSESTVHQHIRKVRRKYVNARKFVNLVESKYRSKGLSKYLWVKDIETK